MSCIFLIILASPFNMGHVEHEWHNYTFCEQDVFLRDKSEACDIAANQYIWQLQMAGILPGASEVIRYSAKCTTEI